MIGKILTQEQLARPKANRSLSPLIGHTEPNLMIRWLLNLLVKLELGSLGAGTHENGPRVGIGQEDEDNEYYYYYFEHSDLTTPRIDVNFYKGLVMIRVEK